MAKMTPKHNSTIKPHNFPSDSMDGFARKDTLIAGAKANLGKGLTGRTVHRGNVKGSTAVDTKFGCKPVPHK